MRETQDKVCAAIEEVDGCKFRTDAFIRPGGGGGITKVMQGGRVWEKAGVAVSVVYGTMPAESYRMAVGNKDVTVEKVRGRGGRVGLWRRCGRGEAAGLGEAFRTLPAPAGVRRARTQAAAGGTGVQARMHT